MKVSVTSGQNLGGPYDLPISYGQLRGTVQLGATVPSVGQQYSFDIVYADGSTGAATTQVTGVIAGFATPTNPVGASSTVPTFQWTGPNPAPASHAYDLYVVEDNYGYVWWRTGLPSSRTSIVYNDNQQALKPSLTTGVNHVWYLQVRDPDGNRSIISAAFVPQ